MRSGWHLTKREVSSSQEIKRSCICVLGVPNLPPFLRYPIRFSTVLFFILFYISLFSGQIERKPLKRSVVIKLLDDRTDIAPR